jgi:hypothetical protein
MSLELFETIFVDRPWVLMTDKYIFITVNILHNFVHSSLKRIMFVRFEVFTAVTMKNGVFWNVTPCGACTTRRFEGT